MPKSHILIGVIVLVLLIGYIIYQSSSTPKTIVNEEVILVPSPDEKSDVELYDEQTDSTGPVTVTLKPLSLPETGEWEFELTLQTHSVDLSMDVLESIVIIGQNGEEMKPTSWDGDPPGGHHRTGVVRFTSMNPIPDTIMLQARNIADVPVREFIWIL